jgi:Secretion system C-terminal sorting domain/Kazal-type serine protease inhibitor domain
MTKLPITFVIIMCFIYTRDIAQCIDTSSIDQNQIDLHCPIRFEDGFESGEYDFVCGCNGVTYPSKYCAEANGLKSWTMGPCQCHENTWVDSLYEFNGINVWPFPRNTICGCDNKTYLNGNHAWYSGVTTWTKGSCKPCIDSSVINLQVDLEKCLIDNINVFLNFAIVQGTQVSLLRGCDGKYYNSICEAFFLHGVTKFYNEEICNILPIEKRDTAYLCPDIYEPVCGCDNIVYKNACIAEKHFGVLDYYNGNCRCFIPELIGQFPGCASRMELEVYDPVCSCDQKTYFNACTALDNFGVVKLSRGACTCYDSSFVDKKVNCEKKFEPVCGCDGHVYYNECDAIYKNGIMNHIPCNCIEPELIDTTIVCEELFNYDPVCGCDGRTYPNECYANYKAGVVWIPSSGPCPTTCQDSILIFDGFPCGNDLVPVCGCDGVTYKNECQARYHNGVIKWKQGQCVSNQTETFANVNLSYFPNPTSGDITIFCKDDIIFDHISIYDSNMNLILSRKEILKNTSTLSLSDVRSSGIYIVKLTGDRFRSIIKVIVLTP